MKIIVAPDSFKESLTASQAAAAMARGIRSACSEAEIISLPVADGGEGTVESLVLAGKGVYVTTTVNGPLGKPVQARWGLLPGKKAIIEIAAASGLILIPPDARNPLHTCTYGTGQLIEAALDRGCRTIVLGIGGSATNDGGAGALRALGARLLDSKGKAIPPGGNGLASLQTIDLSGLDERLADTELLVACDVNNPLLGEQGAAAVYSPQKGADRTMAHKLDSALGQFARIAREQLARDIGSWPGSGGGGGLPAGLSLTGAVKLQPGIDLVLDTIGFDRNLAAADLVLTGEGKVDAQSAMGKAISGVARRAKQVGVPVIALCGRLGEGYRDLYQVGVDAIVPIADGPMDLATAMARSSTLLETATGWVIKLALLQVAKSKHGG